MQIENRASLVGDATLTTVDSSDWRAFPIAEMWKRGWFEDFSGTMAQARKTADHLVPAFLRGGHGAFAPVALHRKSVRSGGAIHEAAIIAWEARVRHLADRSPPAVTFDRDAIDDVWLASLVALTLDPEGPVRAVDHLRRIGIVLVIERHLPGTFLDGAAMYAQDGYGSKARSPRRSQ